jgi:GPH family glycoside/pentoside/hexuronide:cation symporter
VKILEKAGWGFGSVGTQVVTFSQSLFLLYFFTVILGLQPALAGLLIFSGKIFDALLSPLVGRMSDATHSRWGRRRPYLLAGALICAVGVAGLFNVRASTPLLLLSGLLVISIGYSFFNIPYLAMSAEMTESTTERTSLMAWRVAFVAVGQLLSTALLPLVVKAGGSGSTGYANLGVVAGLLILATMPVTFFATARVPATVASAGGYSVAAMWDAIRGNRPFALLISAKALQLVGLAATSAAMLFFFKNVIGGGEGRLALWGVLVNVVSILSMSVWPVLGRRYGKVKIYTLTLLGFSAVGFSWLAASSDTSVVGIITRAVLSGIFVGGLLLMQQSLIPDTMTVDFERTGQRREGIFAGAYSFVEKGAGAVGPLIVGLLFQFMGFNPKAASANTDPTAVYVAIGVVTPLLYLLSAWPVASIRQSLGAVITREQA